MKITATFEDTLEHLTYFATKKGWQTQVTQQATNDDGTPKLDENNQPVMETIDNPYNLEQFLTDWAKQLLLAQIGDPITQDILEQSRQAGLAQIAETVAGLEQALTITVV